MTDRLYHSLCIDVPLNMWELLFACNTGVCSPLHVDILLRDVKDFSGKLVKKAYRAHWKGILEPKLFIHQLIASHSQSYPNLYLTRTCCMQMVLPLSSRHFIPSILVCFVHLLDFRSASTSFIHLRHVYTLPSHCWINSGLTNVKKKKNTSSGKKLYRRRGGGGGGGRGLRLRKKDRYISPSFP